jgi:NarL family two-component system sensor histidine kinase LiaS
MEQLRDFLGAIDTKYTTWDDMMNHFKEYGFKLLSPDIHFNLEYSSDNNRAPQPGFLMRFNLYRIFKEALGNIVKHAHAKNVRVTVSLSSKEMEMRVADNGIGFVPEEAIKEVHYGIRNMQRRAKELGGILNLHSEKGKGTFVHLRIPIG